MLPIPVETITSPIMEAYVLVHIIADAVRSVKSCFVFSCKMGKILVSCKQIIQYPRRIILAKRENTGFACGL